MNNNKYFIRRAETSDINDIYDIKYKAFKKITIPYTIYQTDKSINYINKLIANNSNNNIFVICNNNKVLGYYFSTLYNHVYFLNYIAVAKNVQGLGLGTSLLKHFEKEGKEYCCKKLMLETFECNRSAVEWYLKSGYHEDSRYFYIRISIKDITEKKYFPLLIDNKRLENAYTEENIYGFSKVKCICGTGKLTIGFISNHTCKVIEYEGIKLEEAIKSICHFFKFKRNILIYNSSSKLSYEWPLLSSEKVLRLSKEI